MRIGGLSSYYPTYVYNPNILSSYSMNKLSRISDDVLDKKVDYSGLVAEENQNPLKKGQTIDFEGILAKQMQQGQNRAAQIMQNGIAPVTERKEMVSETDTLADETAVQNNLTVQNDNDTVSFQMQRAIQAYEMFMTA